MERGALIAGRYELTELLGRGGMGEVWAGRDRELHRSVAVKLLHRDDNAQPELVQRFEREAVAAAQINHPNIVALYDRGTHGHLQFLVMEHVEGTSLAQYLHRQGPLDLDRALEIAQEICAALVAAHAANVVHYDIKPSNVMLTATGSIKVVDFGIAGFTHTHTFTVAPTTGLSPVGTAQYGAPEQFLDQRGDERSDLYALGSVLFAMLTGEPPFADGTPLSVIRRKLDEEPRPVAALRPDVPAPVAQLLTDLLRRDPEDRPRTAVSVRQRLTRLRTVSAGRDIGEAETESVAPPAATLKLSTGRPEAEDAARSTDAEPPKTPVSARRWTASRRIRLLAAALPVSLVLAVTAVTYYSSAARHRDTTGTSPSESATAAAQYLRMPDFCGYLQRNQFRGRQEMTASELGSDTENTSKKANCGWKSPDSSTSGFEMTLSATLLSKEGAAEEMASIKLGRATQDIGRTVSQLEGIADEAKQWVTDESIAKEGKPGRLNSTTIWFRHEGLFIDVSYREFGVPLNETDNKTVVTERAKGFARSLEIFLNDEPENHEKPIWG
ncbi:serine/threonine protein kinase [Streptomyces capitiformicae]|uniref:non-specific serine/threonine protein kinase n=1 Tax=Streptomyces capitiformicae TaxID=2014920 RepID=A0A918ZVL5_9ACTN|nr:serine/threonine-protein kinase [Streptomyces capitiformicae]GHE72631.1 hypothetical protein GCM10017771_96520 [Streptomyces capitiformicae]